MIKENDYIQLPPLRRNTDLKVVMALWEYVKMPEESRQKVLAFLDESEKNNPRGCRNKNSSNPMAGIHALHEIAAIFL